MGMILGFFYLIYILVAVGIYKAIKRKTDKKWIKIATLTFLILLPTYDIIITNILGAFYSITSPSYIKKKIEYPISIYWEDNIYPGFTKEDRKLMITNYLNGIHLKIMALNSKDGKIYVYKKDVPKEKYDKLRKLLIIEKKRHAFLSEEIKKYETLKNHDYLLEKAIDEVREVIKKEELLEDKITKYIETYKVKEEVYTKETMPKMNYTIRFNEVKLNFVSRRFLYSDETKIIDNNTDEIVAYNRRIMPFFYNILPDFSHGNRYYAYWGWEFCKTSTYLYYNGDGFGFIGNYGTAKHKIYLNVHLYNKYIKGEK